MSFATSLLAMSIHSLAALPPKAAHVGTEVAFANFFKAMGGNVTHSVRVPSGLKDKMKNPRIWVADAVVDFGDFQVILEISSHESTSGMAFVHPQPQADCPTETHHNKVKQALAYAAKSVLVKPTVCMVASNLEFIAFNPESFKLKAMTNYITTAPSQYDGKASQWVKKQKAFKVIQKQKVASLADYSKAEFISYLRTVAGLPPQEVRLVAE